jgi:gamma-glutamyltranspeptidase/glutathione hydrolase
LTAADLAGYRPKWRSPIRFGAFGWEFASMDLPSSGGIIQAEMYGLLERLGWRELERGGAASLHLVAEVWRQAFADRLLLGDPAHSDATAEELTAPARLDRLADLISPIRARSSQSLAPAGVLPPAESPETTHLSVLDAHGNAVALTTTLNGSFGSKLWVPGFGFLNHEMDDFTTAPGQPNLYGLIQGEANTIAPGRRMLSSMSPTIAWRGDELLVFGAQGGSRIPTTSAWVALGVIVDGLELQEALDRPRIHHQWLPDTIASEPRALSPETRAALERLGHVVREDEETGKVCVVRRLANGLFEAAGDPRGPDFGDVVEAQP